MVTKLSNRFRDIEDMKDKWQWFFGFGLLLMLLGALTIWSSVYGTVVSIMLLGIFLICAGIVQIVQSFLARQWSGFFLALLLGVLYIVTGFFCVTSPASAATSIVLWIAAFCFVVGIFKMLAAAILRFEQAGWVFFNGAVTFLLGLIIYFNWPISGLWVIGLFVGIDMILSGWSWLCLAFTGRNETQAKGE